MTFRELAAIETMARGVLAQDAIQAAQNLADHACKAWGHGPLAFFDAHNRAAPTWCERCGREVGS